MDRRKEEKVGKTERRQVSRKGWKKEEEGVGMGKEGVRKEKEGAWSRTDERRKKE